MKVLHITTGLSQGGAERQLANLAAAIPEQTAVFSLKEPGVMAQMIREAGVPIFTGGVRRGVSPAWMPALSAAIQEVQPAVLMGWMYHGNLAASLARWMGHAVPIVWNIRHSVHDMRREKASRRLVIRSGAWFAGVPTRVIYNSATAAKQHEGLGYPSEKRVVLPNGFDLERFKPDSDAREARRSELGLPPDQFLLGVVGRAHPMKNHHGWLKAFQALVDGGLPVHCVMAGTGVADSKGSVATTVREAGLGSNITLLPPTDSPESLYPALDLLVMPSLWGEGFPNVVGEAMACGVPALVTDVGDAASVVGETGFVSESGTPDFLASGVRSALVNGREGLGRLGAAARERMVKLYGLEVMAERYRALCDDLMREQGSN